MTKEKSKEETICKYCYGKGTYSAFKAGGTFGDSFDGYVYIKPEIEIHPCRCQKVIESEEKLTKPYKCPDCGYEGDFIAHTREVLKEHFKQNDGQCKVEFTSKEEGLKEEEKGANWWQEETRKAFNAYYLTIIGYQYDVNNEIEGAEEMYENMKKYAEEKAIKFVESLLDQERKRCAEIFDENIWSVSCAEDVEAIKQKILNNNNQ